jgi:hypothetical protein
MSPIPLVFTLALVTAYFTTSCASRQSAPMETTVGVPPLLSHADTNEYHAAFIDVNAEGNASVDSLYIEGLIWDHLKDIGIGIALSDEGKTNADLHVICRFKHTLMTPAVTPGFQIKTTSIGKCTIKIVDKKTGKVLIEKSWVRGKKNGELKDFIGSVFAEWKKQRLVITPPVSAPPQQ